MTQALVAYEADSPWLSRVKHCLGDLGSPDPDADIAAMGDFVPNAEATGAQPGVIAAAVFAATHHMHAVANVGVGVALPAAAESSAAERLYRVEYVSKGKAHKVFAEADTPAEALAKAQADAESRGQPFDHRHQIKTTPERKVRLIAAEERPERPGYYAVAPNGKIVGGPYKARHEAAPAAQAVNGYVQYEAGEAPAKMKLGIAGEETPRQLIDRAADTFPDEFGMREFPGKRFRINRRNSYISDSGVTLYTETWNGDRWVDFAKGSPEELHREVVESPVGPRGGAEAPRHRSQIDIDAALHKDPLYRKLAAKFWKAEPGSPASLKLDADLARRREQLLTDPEFKVAEMTPALVKATGVAESPCGCAAEEACGHRQSHPKDQPVEGNILAAEAPVGKRKALRWHRDDAGYYADGFMGKYTIVKQTPDRRHDVRPYKLSIGDRQIQTFDGKTEAQDFAQAWDDIVPNVDMKDVTVAPSGGPILVKGAKFIDGCPSWLTIRKDQEKIGQCVKRMGVVNDAADIYRILGPEIGNLDQEVFVLVLLDVKGQGRGLVEIARGQRSKVVVEPSEGLRYVLATGASSYWCAHAHPSGDAEPSAADKRLTKAFEKATKEAVKNHILPEGVEFCGHVVIGNGEYGDAETGKVTKVKS
jgi:DNA repair protein RadC